MTDKMYNQLLVVKAASKKARKSKKAALEFLNDAGLIKADNGKQDKKMKCSICKQVTEYNDTYSTCFECWQKHDRDAANYS